MCRHARWVQTKDTTKNRDINLSNLYPINLKMASRELIVYVTWPYFNQIPLQPRDYKLNLATLIVMDKNPQSAPKSCINFEITF